MTQITHVAVRYSGRIFSLPKPYRHNHIYHMMVFLSKNYVLWTGDNWQSICMGPDDEDGFLATHPDGSQSFLNRKEALALAKENGQLNENPVHGDEAYSENFW